MIADSPSPAFRPEAPGQKKVIYILGAGRSGSTVLDIVFNASRGVVSTGEIMNLPRNGWIRNEFCSCGKHVKDCDFWTAVRREWLRRIVPSSSTGLDEEALVQEFVALQARFERIRYLLLPGLAARQRSFRRYLSHLNALYGAVFAVSGAEVLVDSSKKHVRGFFLDSCEGFTMFCVHLVRDSRGVSWSFAKSFAKDVKAGLERDLKGKSFFTSARDWLVTNCLSSLVVRRLGPRALRMRYEDFVADPAAELKKVAAVSGVSLAESVSLLAGGGKIVPGHTVAGNRVRMQPELKLKPDFEWQDKLSPSEKRMIWLVTAPLMKAYGYSNYR